MEAITAANCAEECCKYAAVAEAHHFDPIAVETMGVSISTQPFTLFMREFPFPGDILSSLF